MNKLIIDFERNYPQTTEMAVLIRNMDLPLGISMWVSINCSLLLAKLKRGDYNYLRNNNNEMPDEIIDCFGKTYLQNIKGALLAIGGDYTHIKSIKKFNPDTFIIALINSCVI